ncbi:trimeric intracellular cation channel family protein [Prevotella sp. HUN102]|uniref:trimeric intracellular cation channel family protein n=1 Tax=Prevotella sp. HUN102 TaxID=1392486 RepID=UPI00048CA821|nr:trimeric intracellular cation channel family protein [Prevotella sp. HUN102]
MIYNDPELVHTLQQVLEVLGTFAFAISGIRHAAAKHFDWFGGYVCGVAVAIGGGTIRDLILGVAPFWTTDIRYLLFTGLALILTVAFRKAMKQLDNAWFVFDTLGLAFFTIAGMQKTLELGHPFWLAIVMGCMTGVAGGVIRDVILNNVPVIFHKEIYAIASIAGGFIYWALYVLGFSLPTVAISTFLVICLTRFIAVYYHITLPILHDEEEKNDEKNC